MPLPEVTAAHRLVESAPMWLANMPPLGDGFGFILLDYESSKTRVPYAFYSSGVEGMLPSNSGPSFRAVLWTVPSSAFIFLSSEIVGPTPLDSGGASTLIRVKLVLKFTKDTAFLSYLCSQRGCNAPNCTTYGFSASMDYKPGSGLILNKI
jgi:hypothetical protein